MVIVTISEEAINMVSLEIKNAKLSESDCDYPIENKRYVLFIGTEEIFRKLGQAKCNEISKIVRDPGSVRLAGGCHCDAIAVEVSENEGRNRIVRIKIFELTKKEDRDLNLLFNKQKFCVKFITTVLDNALPLEGTIKPEIIFVVNPELREKIEKLRGQLIKTYFSEYYRIGKPELIVVDCSENLRDST